MNLDELRPGQRGRVAGLRLAGPIRRRLRDMGLVEGAELLCLGRSPLGDPALYLLRGSAMALRRSEGQQIEVEA